MNIISLQSGSKGNCIYVETDEVRLLFDAGISGKRAEARLAEHGRDIRQVDRVIISHEHTDHIRSLGIFHRKFGLSSCLTQKTFAAADRQQLGRLDGVSHFVSGEEIAFGSTRVYTYATHHDAVDGSVFVVDDGRHRFGLFTDLGTVFTPLAELLPTLDAVLLESNYDPMMLKDGPYPPYLKRRIAGPHGHISNEEAARLLLSSDARRLQWCCLGHLSENNNCPLVALETHRKILGKTFPLHIATQQGATPLLEVA
ncbi:MAG: MBL fold metallo-hydrolase [Planctomycetia bacterium]|jgi:phosphoribosyl 1,2-cyclic phosphodiesterase